MSIYLSLYIYYIYIYISCLFRPRKRWGGVRGPASPRAAFRPRGAAMCRHRKHRPCWTHVPVRTANPVETGTISMPRSPTPHPRIDRSVFRRTCILAGKVLATPGASSDRCRRSAPSPHHGVVADRGQNVCGMSSQSGRMQKASLASAALVAR